MKLSKRLIKSILIFYFVFFNQVKAIENKILFKVNNQIITSIDILNEMNYLSFVNSEFQKLDKQKKFEISKNNLIRKKINKKDLKKEFKEIKLNEEYLNGLIKNL